jgi:hypothetical protein
MSLRRAFDGAGPEEPVGRLGGTHELHRVSRTAPVAVGTLACPSCDAPVALAGPLAPVAALRCPSCAHDGAVRDSRSLGEPTRPQRVVVRVVAREREG